MWRPARVPRGTPGGSPRADLAPRRFFAARRPHPEVLHRVYLAVPRIPTPARELRETVGLRARTLAKAVNLLEQAGAVRSGRDGYRTLSLDALATSHLLHLR